MDGDFCLLHGTDRMRHEFGNPIAICDACENPTDAEKLERWMLSHGFNVPASDCDEMLASMTTQLAERDKPTADLIWAQAEAKLSNMMLANSLATGHGHTFTDLLRELEWQIKEFRARNR